MCPNRWRGLASTLEKACEIQAHDRGLREVICCPRPPCSAASGWPRILWGRSLPVTEPGRRERVLRH